MFLFNSIESTKKFILSEGKTLHNPFYFYSGYGAGGRLGIGGSDSVCQPMLLESIQHVAIKTVNEYFTLVENMGKVSFLNFHAKIMQFCRFWRKKFKFKLIFGVKFKLN